MMHYLRARRLPAHDPRYFFGKAGQHAVAELLRQYGRTVEEQPWQAPFDILVDGLRIEVKTAPLKTHNRSLCWNFNIQNNGVLNEDRSDLYIFRAENLPCVEHLLFKSPLGLKRLSVTARSHRYQEAIKDFDKFANEGRV